MTAPPGRRDIPVHVTDHARQRCADRFPAFKRARIVQEVREAIADCRISAKLPPWIQTTATRCDALYVWNEDGERVYALEVDATDGSRFVVTTVLRRGWENDESTANNAISVHTQGGSTT